MRGPADKSKKNKSNGQAKSAGGKKSGASAPGRDQMMGANGPKRQKPGMSPAGSGGSTGGSANRPAKEAPRPPQAPRDDRFRTLSSQTAEAGGDFQRIYGKHPVREALSTDRAVYKLWIAQSLTPAVMREFTKMAKDRDVPVQTVPNAKLDSLLATVGHVNHQGLVAEIGAYDYADWDSWIKGFEALKAQGTDPFVLVLDQIQDPHNLGAILRTAEAAGVHGVVIPKHGSVGLSETVAKASAGAIENIPVLQVTNLARSLEELKAAGLWIMGLSANEGQNYFSANLKGPIALVIGSEQKGIRQNTEEHCDLKLIIPMQSTRSLNASVAAAVAMYEVVRQRQTAKA